MIPRNVTMLLGGSVTKGVCYATLSVSFGNQVTFFWVGNKKLVTFGFYEFKHSKLRKSW